MTNKKSILSLMRPTGKLHLGHYLGVLTNWVKLQEENECFFGIADWHALTTKFDETDSLAKNTFEVLADWLSSGIDPEKSTIYLQSLIPETAKLHVYLSMITPMNWAQRDPTLKDMVKIMNNKGENEETFSYGLIGYPILMAADILTFNADFVPVGIDQVAHIEIARDIARRFNNVYKTELLKEPAPKLTEIPLLKGLDGNKMGKSFKNDIKISDSSDETAKKIMTAITDRSRLRKTDLGHPDECEVVFPYWKIFGTKTDTDEISAACSKGEIGCADCKRRLACKVNEKLALVREKRKFFEEHPDELKQIIYDGSKKARIKAKEVLAKVEETVKVYR
ncbi:MAG: tryptophan--tRNA ligase [Candidatus Gastranaerophilales bacterium]|nr:tryptophan--tRNA ligase [Candidatus Gastranaerophilales bacterium]